MLNQNHILFQSNEQVKKILSPLEQMSQIHYFAYGVNFPNRTLYGLTTHPEFIQESLNRKFTFHGFYLKDGWHLWNSYQPKDQLKMGAEQGIGNGLIFIKKHQGLTELFEFGGCPDNLNINNFYLNNLNLLKKFMLYFFQEAHDLIKKASLHKINPSYDLTLCDNVSIKDEEYSDKTKILTMIEPMKSLSKRETECFLLLIQGYSITNISEKLSVAVSTVANYVYRIKIKLNCGSKKQMIHLARELGLIEYHP